MSNESGKTDGPPSLQEYADFYDVLGIESGTADDQTINEAYRTLVKQYHPDVSDEPDETMLDLVQTARDVLVDPDERARYDRLGHDKYCRLRLDGQYLSAGAAAPGRSPGQAPAPSTTHGQSPAGQPQGPQPAGSGTDPTVTARDPSGRSAPADVGHYSHDRAFDFLRADQPAGEVNAPDHVLDVLHHTWIVRVVLIMSALGVGVGTAVAGGPGGVTALSAVAEFVDAVGIATASFGYTLIVTICVFTLSGIRRMREFHVGGEATPPPSLIEAKLGAALVLVALGVSAVAPPSLPRVWGYSRTFLLGQPPGPSPWIAGTTGIISTGFNALGAMAVWCGALFGVSFLVAGVTHRAWHARFIDGRPVVPPAWELAAVVPTLAVYWGAIFGSAPLGRVSAQSIGPLSTLIAQGGSVTFIGLSILGTILILACGILQDLRNRLEE